VVAQIKQKTIVEQIMEKVRELIVKEKLKPGDRIPTENELATMFGVGRSSIREAVKVFTYLGVFETQTRRGTILNDNNSVSSEALSWAFLLCEKDFTSIMGFRRALEQEAWIDLSRRFREKDPAVPLALEKMQEQVLAMKSAVVANDMADLNEADYAFHRIAIAEMGNGPILALFETLRSFTYEEIRISNTFRGDLGTVVSEHQAILTAVKNKDPLAAFHKFREHIDTTRDRIVRKKD
jgi:GntR family transcriptional repressor for pyruvate dehydrogenase complex